MDYEKADAVLGAFVLAALAAVVLVLAAVNRKRLGGDARHVEIHLPNIAGIDKGVEVLYKGYRAGAVDRVTIAYEPEFTFVVDLAIKSEIRLKSGTSVSVRGKGFGGGKYLELLPPSEGEATRETLAEGAVLPTVPDVDVMARANAVMGEVQKIVQEFEKAGTVADVQHTVRHAKSAVQNLDHALANLNALLEEDRAALKVSLEQSAKASAQAAEAMRHVPAIMINVEELTAELKRHPWRLVRKSDEPIAPVDHSHAKPLK